MLRVKKGFTLVEMLISLLLSSMLLAMVASLYVTTVSNGTENQKYSRLRADLQSILSVMETDIRRAGYGGRDFMVGIGGAKTVDSINTEDEDCIIYYYQHSLTDNENKMGFRLNRSTHEIQFGTGVDPLAINCYSSGSWEGLSDKGFVKITSLSFTESTVASNATIRSVQIDITGELASASDIEYSVSTKVQVRNLEFN